MGRRSHRLPCTICSHWEESTGQGCQGAELCPSLTAWPRPLTSPSATAPRPSKAGATGQGGLCEHGGPRPSALELEHAGSSPPSPAPPRGWGSSLLLTSRAPAQEPPNWLVTGRLSALNAACDQKSPRAAVTAARPTSLLWPRDPVTQQSHPQRSRGCPHALGLGLPPGPYFSKGLVGPSPRPEVPVRAASMVTTLSQFAEDFLSVSTEPGGLRGGPGGGPKSLQAGGQPGRVPVHTRPPATVSLTTLNLVILLTQQDLNVLSSPQTNKNKNKDTIAGCLVSPKLTRRSLDPRGLRI